MHLGSTEAISTPTDSDFGKKNNKKQLQMWFSPRSRKIRCVLKKSQPETKSDDLCLDTSSIYDFFPSPPHEKPSKPTKKPTQSKKMKKKRLSDINKVWSLEKPERKGGVEKTPKEKCVTFCSQLVALCAPEPNSPEKTFQQESMREADSSKNMENVEVLPQVKSSEKKDRSEVACPVQVSKEKNCATGTSVSTENETTSYKRGREQSRFPFTSQSKRPRRTERAIIGKSGRQADCLEELPQGCPTSPATEHKTPVQISSSVSKLTDTVMKTRSSAVFQAINSPSLSKPPSTPSSSKTCDRMGIPHSPSVLKSPGGNTIARRNYKGETLLHVASIKVGSSSSRSTLNRGLKRQCCIKNILETSYFSTSYFWWGRNLILCAFSSRFIGEFPTWFSDFIKKWLLEWWMIVILEKCGVLQCQLWVLGSDKYLNVLALYLPESWLWFVIRRLAKYFRAHRVILISLTWPGDSARTGSELSAQR